MSIYSQIALGGALTLVGLIASWFVWRRRGAGAGLRGAAWSLVPLALALIGAFNLVWKFGTAIGSFATSFVFSPRVWLGVAVAGLAVVLFAVSGGLRRRRGRKVVSGQPAGGKPVAGSDGGAAKPGKALTQAKGKVPAAADDDLGDVAEILRRRGIR
jgi:hypothetical protein